MITSRLPTQRAGEEGPASGTSQPPTSKFFSAHVILRNRDRSKFGENHGVQAVQFLRASLIGHSKQEVMVNHCLLRMHRLSTTKAQHPIFPIQQNQLCSVCSTPWVSLDLWSRISYWEKYFGFLKSKTLQSKEYWNIRNIICSCFIK